MTAPLTLRNRPGVGRLFALTRQQQEARMHGDPVILNAGQINELGCRGLVTDRDQWHYGPSGSFALAPREPWNASEKQRKRVDLQPVTTKAVRAA